MAKTAGAPGDRRDRSSLFLVLLFCSGFVSLVYEVVWTRVLLSVFGATVYASGTVLTAFMLGLALGSWLASRWTDRAGLTPLRQYAVLELCIGLYALVFPLVLAGVNGAFLPAFSRWGSSFFTLSVVRFALALVALVLPATLMGATLPVITRRGVTALGSLGSDLGRLYGVNTVGAALGTFITGFFLLELLGIRLTTLLAAGLNILIFLGAWWLGGPRDRVEGAAVIRPERTAKKAGPAGDPGAGPRGALIAVLFLSGACALGYEVLWSRILVYVIGNFVHSFALMLTTVLVGISLGGWVVGRLTDRLRRPELWLAACQLVIGVSALLMLPAFGKVLAWRDAFLDSLANVGSMADYRDPWWQFTAWKIGVGMLLMIVPTFCMGASFPLAARLFVVRFERVARGVGVLYAGNTVGGILGSFAAGFLLIPAIGIRNAVLALAALNCAAAAVAVLGRADGRRIRRAAPWLAAGAIAVALAVAAVPATVFHPIYASAEKGKALIHVDESAAGTITIHETPGGFRVISVNGLNVAGNKFGFQCTQKLQAHFPLLMHPQPRAVMQIGFGTGGTCWSVTQHDAVERVDCVEINSGVIRAAPFFETINHGIYRPGTDPRVHISIEDARNFVATTARRYDVILSDSIHPRFTGNGLLYTKDYYELCARVLNEDGIVSTWLPTSALGVGEFKAIVRSMRASFPHLLLWYMNNTVEGYTILMGRRIPFAVDFDALERRVAETKLSAELAFVHLENVYDLLDCVAISGPDMERYLGSGEMNTEDKPIIEFRAPRNMNRIVTEYRNLEEIIRHRNFPETLLAGGWGEDPAVAAVRRATFERYFKATTGVLSAHQAHVIRQYDREEALLQKALAINPEDRDAPYLLQRLESIRRRGIDPEW